MISKKSNWIYGIIYVCAILINDVRADSFSCNMCQDITALVEKVIVRNTTATDNFKEAGSNLCRYVPETMQVVCEEATKRVDTLMFRCAIQNADLVQSCFDNRLGICSDNDVRKKSATNVKCDRALSEDILKCKACKFTLSGVLAYIDQYAKNMIRASSTELCESIYDANDEIKKCKTFLAISGHEVMSVSARKVDAEDICCNLGVCPAATLD